VASVEGLTQDTAVKFRTIEGRIVGTRGGTSRWNQVLNNVFYRCGKGIDFPNRDNAAEGNLYSKDWGEVYDETQAVGRGLNWMSSPPPALMLDLEAWRKVFGFDMKGAYADMNIDVDLDALTLSWSIGGDLPQQPVGKHFLRDLLGQVAGERRKPGPLIEVPGHPTTISIDPRQPAK